MTTMHTTKINATIAAMICFFLERTIVTSLSVMEIRNWMSTHHVVPFHHSQQCPNIANSSKDTCNIIKRISIAVKIMTSRAKNHSQNDTNHVNKRMPFLFICYLDEDTIKNSKTNSNNHYTIIDGTS